MPEWLRLLRPLAKRGASATREAVPALRGRTISFTPSVHPLENTYFVPISSHTYTAPAVSTLQYPNAEIQRTVYRGSLGIPDGYEQHIPLSFPQARTILRNAHQNHGLIDNSKFNAGLRIYDNGYLDYRNVLNRAGNALYSYRSSYPYGSVQEFIEEEPLYDLGNTYVPNSAGVQATRMALEQGGYNMLDPVFDPFRYQAVRQAVDSGTVGIENPFVMQEIRSDVPRYGNLEGMLGGYSSRVGGFGYGARDASESAVRKLSPYAAKYLTAKEKAELLRKALPDDIKLEDLTPEQIKAFKSMAREDEGSGVAHAFVRRYNRDFLNTMDDLESLPEPKRDAVSKIIQSAYRAPTPIDSLSPYKQALSDQFAEDIKRRFRIDLSSDDLRALFNVRDPKYPEVAARARAAGAHILPGDIQHMGWFQVRGANEAANNWAPDLSTPAFDSWTPEQKQIFTDRSRALLKDILTSQAKVRTGIQAKALRLALPRQTGVFEQNTSPDSYLVNTKTAVTSPEYGVGPGKIKLVELPIDGDETREFGNNLQLNRVRYRDGKITSDLNVPGVEQNAFTPEEAERLLDLLSKTNGHPDEVRHLFDSDPIAKDTATRMINVLRAINERDVNVGKLTFDKINRKQRELGLPEIAPPVMTAPISPDNPTFYDSDNISKVMDLLYELHRESQYLEPSAGFAMQMKRTPVGSLKQKQGGKIPNWAKRHIQ